MPSPFPGMDPYLEDEALWPLFHHQLVMCLYQMLLPGLVDRYRARVAQRHYATEQALFTSIIREEHHEDFIEIRQRSDGRLVTLVDVVSPANKTDAAGPAGLPGAAPRGPRARRQPRRDRPGPARPADAGLLARRPARLGLRRHRHALDPAGALRDLHRHAAEAPAALPPAAGRRRPRHGARPAHRLHALLRPGRLRGQDRLRQGPAHAARRRRPPLARRAPQGDEAAVRG